jgi:outer membrane lipoprotein-sorting protein
MKIIYLPLIALIGAPAALVAQTTARPVPPAPAARASGVDAVLDRAARAYRGVKSLRASFEQTLVNPLTGSSSVQTGELFQQGTQWSARFSKPQGDRYVLAGRTLWVYTPSSAPKQALRLTLDPDAVASFDVVEQLARRPRERFTITAGGAATVAGRATQTLNLVPRAAGRLTKAAVWVDDRDGTVRQLELTENTGLVRRVRFENLRFNARVPASEFAFTPPAGVRVIDDAALRAR